MHDAIFLSESIPYYNTYEAKNEDKEQENETSKKEKKKLFHPNKNIVLNSPPKWSIGKESPAREKKIDENYTIKIEKLKKSWEDKKIKFTDDVSLTYLKLYDKALGGIKYSIVFYIF